MDTNGYGFFTFIYEGETKFVEDFAESKPWPSFMQDAAIPYGCCQRPLQATNEWITPYKGLFFVNELTIEIKLTVTKI